MPRDVNLGLLVTMHRCEMAGCVEGLRWRSLPSWEGSRGLTLAAEVEEVPCVGCRVALSGNIGLLARLEVSGRDGERLLQLGGRFHKGCDEAGNDVPFDVAVEQPDSYSFG